MRFCNSRSNIRAARYLKVTTPTPFYITLSYFYIVRLYFYFIREFRKNFLLISLSEVKLYIQLRMSVIIDCDVIATSSICFLYLNTYIRIRICIYLIFRMSMLIGK